MTPAVKVLPTNNQHKFDSNNGGMVGQHCTMVSIHASRPSCPGFNSQPSQKNSEEKLSILLRLIWLEESGQWLENVNQTHLQKSTMKVGPI